MTSSPSPSLTPSRAGRLDRKLMDRIRRKSGGRDRPRSTPVKEVDFGKGTGQVTTHICAPREKRESGDEAWILVSDEEEDITDTLKILRTVEVKWDVE